MKPAPTLADEAIRASYKNDLAVPRAIATDLVAARRFVLDDNASRFLADLGHASYVADEELGEPDKIEARAHRTFRVYAKSPAFERRQKRSALLLDQARQMARAPHELTWIEYSHRAFRDRTLERYGGKFSFIQADTSNTGGMVISHTKQAATGDEVAQQIGYLIRQESETQFLATIIVGDQTFPALTMPVSFAWTTDDSKPTYETMRIIRDDEKEIEISDAYVATGVQGACENNVAIIRTPDMEHFAPRQATAMAIEYIGELRYLWALLAAINDVPTGVKQVQPSHGFFAKGRIRKFLSHSVISILLPKGRDPYKFARHVVAMSRRRAHQVRGHWRRDWTHPGERPCIEHEFYEHNGHKLCLLCGAEKYWVREHERGDPALGYVSHDYDVKYEDK